jgi:hypothetical protein
MTEHEAKPKRKWIPKWLTLKAIRKVDQEIAEYEGTPWPPPLTESQREMISQIAEIAVDEYIAEVDAKAEATEGK